MSTVREAFYEVLRRHGTTTMFANPGSTEVPLLADFPDDLSFVLCLHEGSVVGAATGWAIGRDGPGLAVLHTTAGYGNAVGAIATARVNRVPLVVVVGQQDRRHLAHEPFLAGDLDRLAGDYPVWTATPARPQDVPALVSRAHHEAVLRCGPAVVIVPMDDWEHPYDDAVPMPAASRVHVAAGVDEHLAALVADELVAARCPVLVTGAGAAEPTTWVALGELAGSLACPVWGEPFGARPGFPGDDKRFAGQLPANRAHLRTALAEHDLVVVVGTSALRQYGYEEGPLFAPGTRVVVLTDDATEAARSVADVAVVTPLPVFCRRLAELVHVATKDSDRQETVAPHTDDDVPTEPGPGLRAADVYRALGQRLPADAALVEESPSTRSYLQDLVPARSPWGFLSAAMGGLGFAMPAAIGLRLAQPGRPVVAVVGDGSSMYACQSLWTAQRYGVGVLFVVLSNGGYAIMDQLADQAGGRPPWPSFDDIDIGGLAASLGCATRRVTTLAGLRAVLDEVVPDLAARETPLLLDVVVAR